MTAILGINAYHSDASACLVKDGRLIAAAEEERFRRVKHWAGFPELAIQYCLEEARAKLSDVDFVAINQDAQANILRKVSYMIGTRPDLSLVLDRIRKKNERRGIREELERAFSGQRCSAEIKNVEHHLAHLASAYFVSPFEEATVVSVDGFGDFASAAWGRGRFEKIDLEDRIYFPHSLGIAYMAITQYLGFRNWGDEYKVMGLAPYGKPAFVEHLRNVVRLQSDGTFRLNLEYFRHHKERIEDQWENGEPRVATLYSALLEENLGPPRQQGEEITARHKDIARSIQAIYEEALLSLLNRLQVSHGCDALALAGGCGMNSVANGRILSHTPYKRLYVQAAAGDAGGAIGAAFHVWHSLLAESGGCAGPGRRFEMDHAYWGPEFSDREIERILTDATVALADAGCESRLELDEGRLCDFTAKRIAAGHVVGWFQGRMEWGPRALGNRSILCDPRRADMKDILNIKIKRRESFRPFAPSILRESMGDWFECEDDVPFMMQVYQIREGKRSLIPAVTHVDGSGRLQTVRREANPRYYRLIEAFSNMTGVPMVLNTSFNENEPIVCNPTEALDCFMRTKMDILVLGNWIVSRDVS